MSTEAFERGAKALQRSFALLALGDVLHHGDLVMRLALALGTSATVRLTHTTWPSLRR